MIVHRFVVAVDVVRIAVVAVSTSMVIVVARHAHRHRCAHLVCSLLPLPFPSHSLLLSSSLRRAHHCRRRCARLVGCACHRHHAHRCLMSSSSSGPVRVLSFVAERPSDGGIGAVVGVGGVCGCVVVVGVGHGMRRSGAPAASRSHAESLSGIGVGVAPDRAVVEVKDL
ncbi:hypothetical protein EDB84DRAFT_1487118, partial [Lactarius hengduanensis]